MTRDAITSEPAPARKPILALCGCWTTAPVIVGDVQSMSGGAGFTQYACPDHVHQYPPRARWGELPAVRP
ncbi:hypothetical protein [Streptomyces sp. BPTC-684]|uniref:hypothetical protein n=1 Tax=Streptomyces sp. BPTC-684 TaxID=3043734 RepID=UPI0024B0AC29|nr:hypothetical protein [Streptomyces sp. BPTC-684]WHM36985.1 hypothetical protein QIY60_08830 [Streptomyces sp. BPTC-684]